MKLCIVVSPGGHLYQAYLLRQWWRKHDRFWVSLPSPDVSYLLKEEQVRFAFGPENRNILNFVKNTFLALKILIEERPEAIFSTGAGLAPPFFLVAKILGITTVYLEPYDFTDNPSMSARLVAPFASYLLVQHRQLQKFFPKAYYWGSVI